MKETPAGPFDGYYGIQDGEGPTQIIVKSEA